MRETARTFSAQARQHDAASALSPSLAELLTVGLLGAPCCGHVELCDHLCRDGMCEDEERAARREPR